MTLLERSEVLAVLAKHMAKAQASSAEFQVMATRTGDRKLATMAAIYRVVAEHLEIAALEVRTLATKKGAA